MRYMTKRREFREARPPGHVIFKWELMVRSLIKVQGMNPQSPKSLQTANWFTTSCSRTMSKQPKIVWYIYCVCDVWICLHSMLMSLMICMHSKCSNSDGFIRGTYPELLNRKSEQLKLFYHSEVAKSVHAKCHCFERASSNLRNCPGDVKS